MDTAEAARAPSVSMHGRFAPVATLAASTVLAALAVGAILDRVGHPALPLDDAFIHAQYARRLAEGSFYGYVAGEGYSSGATSPVWPALLAPFHAAGFRGAAIAWPMWALGTLGHAGVVLETGRLAERLAGRFAGFGAALMTLCFAPFAWFAWSGMETILLTFVLVRAARVAAAALEDPRRGATTGVGWRRHLAHPRIELASLGLLAPLVRPEGALVSVFTAVALLVSERGRGRALALLPVAGPLVVPLVNLGLVGHATSATAIVKWYVGNPYYRGGALYAAVGSNIVTLYDDLLAGGWYTSLFLPSHLRLPILLGLAALAWAGWRTTAAESPLGARSALRPSRRWSALFTLAVALGSLVPCTYMSFLWNRVRYLWPFAPAWIIGLACLGAAIAAGAARAHAALSGQPPPVAYRLIPGALSLAIGVAFATRMPATIADLAQSAHAIERQQVAIGLWARTELPADARIGVNDTGAIAYYGERPTFDVVGLTTEGEARYWVAGAGSRYEHYEQLPRERLPTHFAVYPQWMACPPVLGTELHSATVTDQSILGGVTMVVHEATYEALGSGALPVGAELLGDLIDELDVSDLGSEEEHAFELDGGTDQENQVVLYTAPAPAFARPGDRADGPSPTSPREGELIADGGRFRRAADRFVARLRRKPTVMVMRVAAQTEVELVVRAGGRELGRIDVPGGGWAERAVGIPAELATPATAVSVETDGEFGSLHYWFYEPS